MCQALHAATSRPCVGQVVIWSNFSASSNSAAEMAVQVQIWIWDLQSWFRFTVNSAAWFDVPALVRRWAVNAAKLVEWTTQSYVRLAFLALQVLTYGYK